MTQRPSLTIEEHNVHPVYRPDIDGLRAVAIISVVLFHAFPTLLPGGFVGVDIFFVISGFLITSIIIKSFNRGGFDFIEFYAHRANRIFPALIIVQIVSVVIGWNFLFPADFKELGRHVAAGAGFVQNINLWMEAGYFDTASELKPMLHLWSLAIEEQFYLVFPLFVWLLWRLRQKIAAGIVILISLSFYLNINSIDSNATGAFFLPWMRFWELMSGSLLAYATNGKKIVFVGSSNTNSAHLLPSARTTSLFFQEKNLLSCLSIAGFFLVIFSVFLIDKTKSFPGWWALPPVTGSVLIILAGPNSFINKYVLANRIFVFVGLISYPLYLWHWPILSFLRIITVDTPSTETRLVAVASSILLAWVTYRIIERPIRFGKKSSFKTVVLCTSLAITGFAGYHIYKNSGFPDRYPKFIQELSSYKYDAQYDYRSFSCFLGPEQDATNFSKCNDGPSLSGESIFLWGDSFGAHLYPGLKHAYGRKYRIIQRTAASCPPIPNFSWQWNRHCETIYENILEEIRRAKPRRVILSATWNAYDWIKIDQTIDALKKMGVGTIILVGPVPQWKGGLPKQLMLRRDINSSIRMNTGLNDAPIKVDSKMESYAKNKGVVYFSPIKILCSADGCLTRLSDDLDGLITWDFGHLTKVGSVHLVSKLPLD